MRHAYRHQKAFMQACGQCVDGPDEAIYELYLNLIGEEYLELVAARASGNRVDQFDALLDIVVVCIGAMVAAGLPASQGWLEVMHSNLNKLDEEGRVTRREDGKILKPPGWQPPDLKGVMERRVARIQSVAYGPFSGAADLRRRLQASIYYDEESSHE